METKYIPINSKLILGFFDLGAFLGHKMTSIDRIIETIKTAEKAEKLGFHRYWVAEHRSEAAAWRGTDIILTLIANHTSKIRVGSAGVQLTYYNPLLVSENYKLLANLFNNRIDLGLVQGRADIKLVDELLMSEKKENAMTFLEKVEFLRSTYFHPINQILISPPYEGIPPDLWIMGTSLRNLDFAIEKKINYCLSICHIKLDPLQLRQMEARVKSLSSDNEISTLPEISIMVSVICGKTQKKAEAMAKRAIPTMNLSFSGDQNACYDFLIETKERFGVSEIIIGDLCGNQKDRISSISLLSEIISN
jgi:luciferase family oxidoreductase group 1